MARKKDKPEQGSKQDPRQEKDDDKQSGRPYRVRLPGFISEDDVGLGDVVKKVTYMAGFRPCSGCERRAAALNRWMTFTGSR